MTPEAALSKLSYILARKDLNTQEKKKVFWTLHRNLIFRCIIENLHMLDHCTAQCLVKASPMTVLFQLLKELLIQLIMAALI